MSCQEPDPITQLSPEPELNWRKSSASAGGGECVEVAKQDSSVLVRDSFHRPGRILRFTPAQWRWFVQRVKSGKGLLQLSSPGQPSRNCVLSFS